MAATDPGAMFDSPTSKRSTAKRTGAFGSTGTAGAAADPDGRALARGVGSGLLTPLADGFVDASAGRIGVTV